MFKVSLFVYNGNAHASEGSTAGDSWYCVVDNTRTFIESENFSATSLNDNRELGIVTNNQGVIDQTSTTFSADFASVAPY